MAKDLNRVQLIGRLVSDPEAKETTSGKSVLSIRLATNKQGKDGNESADYHNLTFWQSLAEVVSKYLKKGSKIYVEGKLHYDSWENEEKKKFYKTEIVVDEMIMLDGKK